MAWTWPHDRTGRHYFKARTRNVIANHRTILGSGFKGSHVFFPQVYHIHLGTHSTRNSHHHTFPPEQSAVNRPLFRFPGDTKGVGTIPPHMPFLTDLLRPSSTAPSTAPSTGSQPHARHESRTRPLVSQGARVAAGGRCHFSNEPGSCQTQATSRRALSSCRLVFPKSQGPRCALR